MATYYTYYSTTFFKISKIKENKFALISETVRDSAKWMQFWDHIHCQCVTDHSVTFFVRGKGQNLCIFLQKKCVLHTCKVSDNMEMAIISL